MKIKKDKYLHFLSCGLVSLLTSIFALILGLGNIGIMYSGITSGISIGLGKEYGDYACSNNKWDNYDLIADILGALIGSSLILTLNLIIN